MGESIAEVTAVLGLPLKTEDSGTEKIYFFKGQKVTFRDGKVIGVNLLDEGPALPPGGVGPPQPTSG